MIRPSPLLLLALVGSAGAQTTPVPETNNEFHTDFLLACSPGFRISAIRRSLSADRRVGALTIECELIESQADQVKCTTLSTIPECSGLKEGCTGNSWLAGFQAFLMENATKVLLLDPVCCESTGVLVENGSCVEDSIAWGARAFDHSIASDLIYQGLRCWHQYSLNKTLSDIAIKLQICSFQSATTISTSGQRLERCGDCACDCGIPQCPDGTQPFRIVHKTLSTKTCSCTCECEFKCFPSK